MIDIDTRIKTWDHGYYAHDIHNPVTFGSQGFEGFSMVLGDVQVFSGLDPMPVLVTQEPVVEEQLPGLSGLYANRIQPLDLGYFHHQVRMSRLVVQVFNTHFPKELMCNTMSKLTK